ncbi:MAG TPA: hypothetical protein VMV77_12655 [Bacteroidales bacterium]|nr:hypothetical protein [Bacteroidales bacterium]
MIRNKTFIFGHKAMRCILFTHALVRKKDNVLGEVGLMFIGYNLTRCISILDAEKLILVLKKYCLSDFFILIRPVLSLFDHFSEKCKFLFTPETENIYADKTSLLRSCELSLGII